MDRYLPPPELPAARPTVLPVFIPFAGCPGRCVYCAQHLQTRQPEVTQLAEIHTHLSRALAAAQALFEKKQQSDWRKRSGDCLEGAQAVSPKKQGVEIAFYGGTFTLLPVDWQEELLSTLLPWREKGIVRAVRCSTRPDAVLDETLRRLKTLGLTCVELGVQSFDDAVLGSAKRGYTGAEAREACARVRSHGLALGVQLLPGLPGMGAEIFRSDVQACLELAPDLARLYPCLVLQGTPLAELWAAGGYQPWTLDLTVPLLAETLLKFQKARIAVARIGLPLGDGFAEDILAGPAHPALGDMARGLALYYWLKEQLQDNPQPVAGLCVPRAWQGPFWGHKGELKPAYATLGLPPGKVAFWDWPVFCLKSEIFR